MKTIKLNLTEADLSLLISILKNTAKEYNEDGEIGGHQIEGILKQIEPTDIDKVFLDLMEGMERKIHPYYPNLTLWYKGDDWYFEQNEENGYLWCQYDRVWSVFEREYGGNYADIQSIIKSLMERHYNLRGLTPSRFIHMQNLEMERHYNLRGINTK